MAIEVRKPSADEEAQMNKCPIWEKEASTFAWHYDESETCLLIEGEVEVTTTDQTVNFGPGDLVIFPAHLDCTWKIIKAVRKHYRFG